MRRIAELLLVLAVCAALGAWLVPVFPRRGDGRGGSKARPEEMRAWPAPRGDLRAVLCSPEGSACLQVRRGQSVVWQYPLDEASASVAWSPDGRRLAALTLRASPASYAWELVLWGTRRQELYSSALLDGEGALELQFSPDGRHLLLRLAHVFGDFDADLGRLVCLDLGTGEFRKVEDSVHRAVWEGPGRVAFRHPEGGWQRWVWQ